MVGRKARQANPIGQAIGYHERSDDWTKVMVRRREKPVGQG
jgi:hypothetical protein